MAKPFFARFILTTGMLWLAAGALYKLFEGSPNDLPSSVKEVSPFGPLDTFRYAIAVELAVIGLVIALPRIGWVFLAGTFAAFIAALVPLVQAGEKSCGCFGGNIEIDPRVMLAVDGGLLLFLLLSAPWRSLPRGSGLGVAALLPLWAVAGLAPFGKIETPVAPQGTGARPVSLADGASSRAGAPRIGAAPGEAEKDSTPAGAGDGTKPAESAPIEATAATEGAGATGDGAGTGEAPAVRLPEFFDLRPTDWVGRDAWETELGGFYEAGASLGFQQGAFLPDSHVIVYRQTCEHCKEHLQTVAAELAAGDPKWAGKTIVLLRIAETKDTPANDVCHVLPEPSEKITFPALARGYSITTPYLFDIDSSGLVQNPVELRPEKQK